MNNPAAQPAINNHPSNPSITQNPEQSRDDQLHQWLTQVFKNQPLEHQKIPGDASFRSYHRLIVTNQKYIVMDAPPEKESVKEFIAVDKLMADYVHVPTMIAIDEQQGFIVLEDLGNTDFADVIAKDLNDGDAMATTKRLYQQAMQEILDIQKIDINDAQAIIPSYDEALLRREMGLFSDWFLPYIGVAMDQAVEQLWQDVQAAIIQQVIAQPQVVVHRDFHSHNLMVLDNSDELGVIDFQDAVIGAYTYDLASLLRDAYINFDENWVTAHLAEFYKKANIDKSLEDFMLDFNIMSLQRHLKVLGIFVRLFERDGKDRYLVNLPKVFNDLQYSLTAISQSDTLQEKHNFNQFNDWIASVVKPAFNQKIQG